ncbi:uncharacterized protein EAF01_007590 [Botrytis porri]|uniref:uncharacterized protein n=1 Tax=Botrytis porri TaxID=87229 RepID=UPI00190156EE|nr:uncharacterized protein EAF01_007590 [Botrytis porri]KAF7900288.1 hypothetical protein EAF01_007590 [Botrytis porri]
MSSEGSSISPSMEEAPPAYSSVDGIHSISTPHFHMLDYLKSRLVKKFSNYNSTLKILIFRHRLRLYELYHMQDHTLPVQIHLIKLGVDAPCENMNRSKGDYNLQRMKNIEISTIVNQEISFFVRVYKRGHNGKHLSQKDVIDYFNAWDYVVQMTQPQLRSAPNLVRGSDIMRRWWCNDNSSDYSYLPLLESYFPKNYL